MTNRRKYHGVTIDEQLSWKKKLQADIVRKKSLVGLAMRASVHLPSATRHLLFNALVLPHLDYCLAAYYSYDGTLSERLEHVQN